MTQYRYAGDRPYNQTDAVDWRVYALLGAVTALAFSAVGFIIEWSSHLP